MWSERIIVDQNILAGKPIIKGTRISVDFILDLLVNDWTNDTIIQNYPQVAVQDIKACLEYASNIIKEENILLL